MIGVLVLLAIIIAMTRPKWPNAAGLLHTAATGLMVHGLYSAACSSRSGMGCPRGSPRFSSACSRC